MANVVDICNLALANLGEQANVSSVDPPEGSPHAERCAQFYPVALNVLLESHDWRFAMRRAVLTAYVENDLSDVWKFRYAVPAGCLRVRALHFPDSFEPAPDVARDSLDFEVALSADGTVCIYSDVCDAVCTFVCQVDPRAFPASFVTALSWKLAAMLAGPLIRGAEGMKMVQSCEQAASVCLEQAKSLDAMQQRCFMDSVPPWIRIRDGSVFMPGMRLTDTGD